MLNFLRFITLAILFSNLIHAGSDAYFSNYSSEIKFDTLKTSILTQADTLKTQDSLKTKTTAKKSADSLAFIAPARLDETGLTGKVFSPGDIQYSDYRFAGNFFPYIPFGMLKDLGQAGQPSEAGIYGLGYNNVTFMCDGLVLNDRLQNSFDAYNIPDINLKYIEVIPLARGFLYGAFSNAAAVNFIPDNTIRPGAYSRIRYYQAPNSEGYFSGDFRTKVSRRIGLGINLTNHSTDPLYDNSGFSHWNGGISLVYLLSEKFNLKADYNYLQNNIQLNGGVDADSISRAYSPAEFDNILYNTISAPVRFPDRYMKNTGHNFTVRLLGEIFSGWRSDVSVYFRNNLQEFRQNEANYNLGYDSLSYISDNNKYRTFGVRFIQDAGFSFADFKLLVNYERTSLDFESLRKEISKNSLSVAGILTFNSPGKAFRPSVFGKMLNYSGKFYSGAGSDIKLNLSDNIQLYGGASVFERQPGFFEETYYRGSEQSEKSLIKSLELSANYRSKFLYASLGFIRHESDKNPLPAIYITPNPEQENAVYTSYKNSSFNAFNLNFEVKLWKFHLANNASYYPGSSARNDYLMPEFTAEGGFYYIDTLFSRNLRLKAGINYKWFGVRDFTITDFQKSITSAAYLNAPGLPDLITGIKFPATDALIPPSGQLDFFMAGNIQENATVYFVFENLLDTRYYISSYYPMPGRGIRLGVTWEFFD